MAKLTLRKRIRVAPRKFAHNLRGWLGYLGLFGKLNPPVFVVGVANSGTTVLTNAIAVHPDIEDRSEARVLWDPDFHTRETETLKTAEDVSRADRYRLRGNFAYYQRVTGKKLVLNKHPENTLRIHFIKKIFPEGRIIHIIRDGRAAIRSSYHATTKSLKKAKREGLPFGGHMRPPGWRELAQRPYIEQFAHSWNFASVYASTAGQQYGPDYIEIRYEDLVADPRAVITRIWDWLGLTYDESLYEKLPVFRQGRNKVWSEALTAEEIEAVVTLAGPGLRRFGYLPAEAGPDRDQTPSDKEGGASA